VVLELSRALKIKWFCNHAPLSILDLILSSFGSYWECSPAGACLPSGTYVVGGLLKVDRFL
jgi:hypothetical protein